MQIYLHANKTTCRTEMWGANQNCLQGVLIVQIVATDQSFTLILSLCLSPQCVVSTEIRDILLAVGSSALLRDVCLLRLTWHIRAFAASLQLVAKGWFYSCCHFQNSAL